MFINFMYQKKKKKKKKGKDIKLLPVFPYDTSLCCYRQPNSMLSKSCLAPNIFLCVYIFL